MEILFINRGSSVIKTVGASSAPAWAVVQDVDLLHAGESLAPTPRVADRIVTWSGSLGDRPFGDEPRTWGPAGWSALHAACDRGAPRLAVEQSTLCLRPHAKHVLSDVPSCARFMRNRVERDGPADPFALLLDPAAMLTPSMLPAAADHLRRIFESIPTLPQLAGIVISNLAEPSEAEYRPVPLHRGPLDPALLASLVRDHVPPSLPLILASDEDVPAQLSLLAGPTARA